MQKESYHRTKGGAGCGSFLECWSSSLHKRVPRFSFGMTRFIGMFPVELCKTAPPKTAISYRFFLLFLAVLEILGHFKFCGGFLCFVKCYSEFKLLCHKNQKWADFGDWSALFKLKQNIFFCSNRIILKTLVIPKESLMKATARTYIGMCKVRKSLKITYIFERYNK